VISAQAHAKQSCVARRKAAARARKLEAPRMIRAANKIQNKIKTKNKDIFDFHQVRNVVDFLVHVGGN
jgi:hypothetical protein